MNEQIIRGEDAKRILEDPLYQESWNVVEKALISSLRTVPLTDAALEREFVRSLQILYKVRGYLEGVMQTGKMELAAAEQSRKRTRNSRE